MISYRSAGRAAILSGLIGLVAYGFLWAYLLSMVAGAPEKTFVTYLRTHDIGVILQSLLMIPLVVVIGDIVGKRKTVAVGVAALALTVVTLLLSNAGLLNGQLFMIWQGLLGAWLIAVCRLLRGTFSQGLRWFGMVVGVGLLIVAVFPIGYFMLVDSSFGPIPWDYEGPPGTEKANDMLHAILGIGGFLGVATLPIWTALAGRRVHTMRRA